jgi:hypothetical protein
MQRHDNILRDKLRHLDQLPEGTSFNTTATWQRLEDQLQNRQRNHKRRWLQFAAILICLMIPAAVLFMRSKPENIPGLSTTKPAGNKITPEPATAKETAITAAHKKQITDRQVFQEPVKKQSNTKQDDTIALINSDPITYTTSPNDVAATADQPVLIRENEIAQLLLKPTTLIPKKPRLKVVHLNELYSTEPAEIVKMEIKRQANAEPEPEPVITTPPKSFWRSKSPPRIPISLTDNP